MTIAGSDNVPVWGLCQPARGHRPGGRRIQGKIPCGGDTPIPMRCYADVQNRASSYGITSSLSGKLLRSARTSESSNHAWKNVSLRPRQNTSMR